MDEEVVEKLETLRNQFSPSRNFQRFREALVSTSGPAAGLFFLFEIGLICSFLTFFFSPLFSLLWGCFP